MGADFYAYVVSGVPYRSVRDVLEKIETRPQFDRDTGKPIAPRTIRALLDPPSPLEIFTQSSEDGREDSIVGIRISEVTVGESRPVKLPENALATQDKLLKWLADVGCKEPPCLYLVGYVSC